MAELELVKSLVVQAKGVQASEAEFSNPSGILPVSEKMLKGGSKGRVVVEL